MESHRIAGIKNQILSANHRLTFQEGLKNGSWQNGEVALRAVVDRVGASGGTFPNCDFYESSQLAAQSDKEVGLQASTDLPEACHATQRYPSRRDRDHYATNCRWSRQWRGRNFPALAAVARAACQSINLQLFSSELPMHRLVFKSICRVSRRRIIEYGPWHADKKDAEQWHAYFLDQLPHQNITIQVMEVLLAAGSRAMEM